MSVLDLDERTISDALETMRADNLGRIRTYAAGRITYDLGAREVYSYGRHFPLFHYVPKTGRQPETVILNGDEWRGPLSRTRDHQAIARRLTAGMRTVIVPFSAIGGAGLVLDSIRPIHVREDANWTERHEIPADLDLDNLESADSMREVDERKTIDYRGEPCAPYGTWSRQYKWRRDGAVFTRTFYRAAYCYSPHPEWRESESWDSPVSELAYRSGSNELKRGEGGVWFYVTHHHRLGDALISAVREIVDPARRAYPFESESDTARETVRLSTFTDNVWRDYCAAADKHEAGASGACVHCGLDLFARVTRRIRARYLSSFDVNEAPPLYFLAQCPRSCGDTVESALESLAPRAVHAALARGRDVRRQGDVFFIATDFSREDIEGIGATFARLILWTRSANTRASLPAPPTQRPATREAVRKVLAIYGTAHSATEVARARSGAVYVRGIVRHVPELEPNRNGRPDHRPLELGEGWYLAVRNTVPRQNRRPRRRNHDR